MLVYYRPFIIIIIILLNHPILHYDDYSKDLQNNKERGCISFFAPLSSSSQPFSVNFLISRKILSSSYFLHNVHLIFSLPQTHTRTHFFSNITKHTKKKKRTRSHSFIHFHILPPISFFLTSIFFFLKPTTFFFLLLLLFQFRILFIISITNICVKKSFFFYYCYYYYYHYYYYYYCSHPFLPPTPLFFNKTK